MITLNATTIFKYLIYIGVLLSTGCGSIKQQMASEGGREAVINNAILDFSRRSRIFKTRDFFKVETGMFTTTKKVRVPGETNLFKSAIDRTYPDVIVVYIFYAIDPILYHEDAKVGVKGGRKFPTNYRIERGKLFYWMDTTKVLTEDAVKTFKKFKLMPDHPVSTNEYLELLDRYTTDRLWVQYFFCKSDLKKYKRYTFDAKRYNGLLPDKLPCGNSYVVNQDQ